MSKSDELAWFGPHWGSLGNRAFPQVPVPTTSACDGCRRSFTAEDQGIQVPGRRVENYHRACWAGQDAAIGDWDEFGHPPFPPHLLN